MKFSEFLMEDVAARTNFIMQRQGQKLIDVARNDASARAISENPGVLLQTINQMDPTNGKFLQYLVGRYIAGEFRLEDKNRVRNALELFIKKRNTLQQKDINQYKSLHDLYDAVEEAPDPELSKKQQKKQTKQEGTQVLLKGDNILILHLLTGEAACYYAAGTKWCTSDVETFERYAKQGYIYIIMVKDPQGNTRKFQFHYQSGQVMDERDKTPSKKDIALLSKFPEWYQFVDMMIQKHHEKLK